MKTRLLLVGLIPAIAAAQLPSSPSLGIAEGRCRAGEAGPALIVSIVGFKDRGGTIKAEVYPANDQDFLADDNVLLNAGKVFRRSVVDVPATGPVRICIRVPSPGPYSLMILHDRDGNRKFGFSTDGIGVPINPGSITARRPRANEARVVASDGITPVTVRLMYRKGLFSFAPISG